MKKHILKNILRGVAAAAAFALASCSFLSLDDDSGSSSGSGSERGAVSVSMFVPDYYAISAGTSARVVAPQTNSVRLGYKAGTAAEYTYLDAVELSDSEKITVGDSGLSGTQYKLTFSGIPVGFYEAGSLIVNLLDSSDNPVSSGTNSEVVTITEGASASGSFYTIPTSSDTISGSLSAGEMKFAKVAFSAGFSYTLTVSVGEGDFYPTVFVFNSDGTYKTALSFSEENASQSFEFSEAATYYLGIYSATDVSSYTLSLAFNSTGTSGDTVDDTALSTHLVDLTGTGVEWNSDTSSVTNTAETEAYLVYNRLVDIEKDSITLQAKVNFSSLSGHVGVGFISVDGTSRKGYQLLCGQNIKNVGCTNGGSGQGFDSKASGFKWETDKNYIFNVSIAGGKISYIVYDASDGTTELASKKSTNIYHDASDLIYPAFGGTQSKNATYSDITITVNGNKYTIDGIDPQSQLPTLTLSSNVVRIKSTETGTVAVNATYNGASAEFTAVSSDPFSVGVEVSGNEITVTPLKTTPSVTVTVINSSAPYITSTFTVVVADYPTSNPSSLNVYPAAGATAAYTDGNLRLTFDEEPTLNSASFITIFDSDGNIADTITMSDEKQTTNAGNTINVKSQLVRVVGNDVLITPHFGALENSKTYYVAIPEGAITGKINGNDFEGLSNEKNAENAWSFTTRETHAATSEMTVSSSESASPDFRTIYGALAAIGTKDTGSYTINVAAGEYYELVNAKIDGTVKIVGPSTAESDGTDTTKNAVIKYINHNDWNGGTAIRTSFYIGGTGNLVLENVTIWNATRRGVDTDAQEAQAEAIYFQSTGTLAAYNSTFKSYQDTIQVGNKGGKAWFYKCYVEGDVDFLWGTADVALFEECTLKSLNDSARTTKTQDLLVARTYLTNNNVGKGFVVLNSSIEIEDGITMSFGRCAGSGNGFYDQCAVVNTTVSGTLSDAWWTEKNYTPLSGYEKFVGWKDYNITDSNGTALSPESRCDKTYEIDAAVYALEYNGRRAILNRVFSSSDEAYASGTAWDEDNLSALETEFNAAEDASKDNVYDDEDDDSDVISSDTTISFGTSGNYSSSKITLAEGASFRDNGGDNSQTKGSFSFKVLSGATISISSYASYTSYTLSAGTFTSEEQTGTSYSYTATSDCTITITTGSGSNGNYLYSITVSYPISKTTLISFGTSGNYSSSTKLTFASGASKSDNGSDNTKISGNVSFKVLKGAVISISSYTSYTSYTLSDGTFTSDTQTGTSYTYTATSDSTITIACGSNNYFYYILVRYPISTSTLIDLRTLFSSLPTSNSSSSGTTGDIVYSSMYYKDSQHGAYFYNGSTLNFIVDGACTVYLGNDANSTPNFVISGTDTSGTAIDSTNFSSTSVSNKGSSTLSGTELSSSNSASFSYTGTSAAIITLALTNSQGTSYLPAIYVKFE